MKKLVICSILVVSCSISHAWGDAERGALLGLVIGGAIAAQKPEPQRYPQPVYPQQYIVPQQLICGYNVFCQTSQQLRCIDEATYDQFGRFVSYQRVCRHN